MVEPKPDTVPGDPSLITAFTQVPEGLLGVMPAVGDLQIDPDQYRSGFEPGSALIEPGYTSVVLTDNQTKVDLTGVDKVAAYRFTFPESKKCHVLMDVSHGLESFRGGEIRMRDDKTFEGFGRFLDEQGREFTLFYSFHFSKPFRERGVWVGDESKLGHLGSTEEQKPFGAYAYFWTHEGESILMKVGVSTEDAENARRNVLKEFPGWDLKELVRKSRESWKAGH